MHLTLYLPAPSSLSEMCVLTNIGVCISASIPCWLCPAEDHGEGIRSRTKGRFLAFRSSVLSSSMRALLYNYAMTAHRRLFYLLSFLRPITPSVSCLEDPIIPLLRLHALENGAFHSHHHIFPSFHQY